VTTNNRSSDWSVRGTAARGWTQAATGAGAQCAIRGRRPAPFRARLRAWLRRFRLIREVRRLEVFNGVRKVSLVGTSLRSKFHCLLISLLRDFRSSTPIFGVWSTRRSN